jgi:hypothetical protein
VGRADVRSTELCGAWPKYHPRTCLIHRHRRTGSVAAIQRDLEVELRLQGPSQPNSWHLIEQGLFSSQRWDWSDRQRDAFAGPKREDPVYERDDDGRDLAARTAEAPGLGSADLSDRNNPLHRGRTAWLAIFNGSSRRRSNRLSTVAAGHFVFSSCHHIGGVRCQNNSPRLREIYARSRGPMSASDRRADVDRIFPHPAKLERLDCPFDCRDDAFLHLHPTFNK